MHFKLIVVMVEDKLTPDLLDAAREAGATGATVLNQARGEGVTPARTFLGLSMDNRVDGMLTVSEALRVMKNPETRTLIIDKRHEDDEYGIVMFSDIARKVLANDRSPDRVNLYEIMSKPVLSVDSGMDIRYATRMIARFSLSRMPVVDEGRFVGLVSYTDVVIKGLKNGSG